jgi:hypothetical protein
VRAVASYLEGESGSQLWATVTSAACGTALAAAMVYLMRDAIRSFEDEDASSRTHTSLTAACSDGELSLAAASVQVGELACCLLLVMCTRDDG